MTVTCLLVASLLCLLGSTSANPIEEEVIKFINNYNLNAPNIYRESAFEDWNLYSNVTSTYLLFTYFKAEAKQAQREFEQQQGIEAKHLFGEKLHIITEMKMKDEYLQFCVESAFVICMQSDESLKRQIKWIMELAVGSLDHVNQFLYRGTLFELKQNYNLAEVELPNGRKLALEPDITKIMAEVRNYTILKGIWKLWFDTIGRKHKRMFEKTVHWSHFDSEAHGYKNTGARWRSEFWPSGSKTKFKSLWQEVEPLYKQLHAYVRRKLYEEYGPDYINLRAPIPAHLFGNLWAMQWNNIFDLVKPYPEEPSLDPTPSMVAKNYDARDIFKMADDFFFSLGLHKVPETFWNSSIFEKPNNRSVICTPSAWNFYDKENFRILMCSVVNLEYLQVVYQQMGHIQYFMQYKNRSFIFQQAANPTFLKAVGDTIGLAASTPKHLSAIGLLEEFKDNHKNKINFLLKQALDKIASLPFNYLVDRWRWRVFTGRTRFFEYQKAWDKARLQYQGVIAPIKRHSKDFDPLGNLYVSHNIPSMRYFISNIIQFQFYESLCEEINHEGPLHNCNFYNSTDAGRKLRNALNRGRSEVWTEVMMNITGDRNRIVSTSSLRRYFKPLENWLTRKNQKNGDVIGWPDTKWRPTGLLSPHRLSKFLIKFETATISSLNMLATAKWIYQTDINSYAKYQFCLQATKERRAFTEEQHLIIKQFDASEMVHSKEKRLLQMLLVEEPVAVLEFQRATEQEVIEITNLIINHLDFATVCEDASVSECSLYSYVQKFMMTTLNHQLLTTVWRRWKEVIGRKMRKNFLEIVELNKQVASSQGHKALEALWGSATDLERETDSLWQEMKPMYLLLHAHLRRRLYKQYGERVIDLEGPIPASIVGSMFGEHWSKHYFNLRPFHDNTKPNVTKVLVEQGWNVKAMFNVADDFFVNLRMMQAPPKFWKNSIFTKPTDGRNILCDRSPFIWDFYKSNDYRVKRCDEISHNTFLNVYYQMAHLQYKLQTKKQPVLLRNNPGPNFKEALAMAVGLSVSTHGYLQDLHLLSPSSDSASNKTARDMNYLMEMALKHLPSLSVAYVTAKWRWNIFNGNITNSTMNMAWWNYKLLYQGVAPSVQRTENDFDPGSYYLLSASRQPISKAFMNTILQFQFYKILCDAAGHVGELYKCNFNWSYAAGKKLSTMMRLGATLPWREALGHFTGTRDLSSAALLKYFEPLSKLLRHTHTQNNETIGWLK